MTEREKFEEWFKRDFHPDITGPYVKNQLMFAWQAATASSQEQVAALSSENVYLREQVMCWARECDRIDFRHTNKVTDAHQRECEDDLKDIQTPATDRFLAEQQAIGVERAIEVSKDVVSEEFQYTDFESAQNACRKYPESDLVGKVEMIEWLSDFAQQLRDEVKP